MLSLLIDAKESRDVATADVVGAFLLADMEDFVLVKIDGDTLNIMCKVNEKYAKLVSIENGKEVLYLRLQKAIWLHAISHVVV